MDTPHQCRLTHLRRLANTPERQSAVAYLESLPEPPYKPSPNTVNLNNPATREMYNWAKGQMS